METQIDINEIVICPLSNKAIIPTLGSEQATGYDLYAAEIRGPDEHGITTVCTNLSMVPPVGFYIEIVPRSSLHAKGFIIVNAPGIIDRDYTGEIFVKLLDFRKDNPDTIKAGERFAQIIIRECLNGKFGPFKIVDNLDNFKTARGSNGFGSTGLF